MLMSGMVLPAKVSKLKAKMVSEFYWVYSDQGTGAHGDLTIYRPKLPEGYHSLGDYAQPNYRPGYSSVVVVCEEGNEGLLALPLDYKPVWTDRKSGGLYDGSLWCPVAPDGYVALGCIAASDYKKPDTNLVRCVSKDILLEGEYGDLIWQDKDSGAESDAALWPVISKNHKGITAGTFMIANNYKTPPKITPYCLPVTIFDNLPIQTGEKKVLLIGIDGCRPDQLNEANPPNMEKLISTGFYNDKAQTIPPTISSPGWASMFTSVWHEQTAVVNNDFNRQVSQFQNFPPFFRRIKEVIPNIITASITDWDPIKTYMNANVDISTAYDKVEDVVETAKKIITGENFNPDVDICYIHLDNVDHAGHEHGYTSRQYREAITMADAYIGEIIAAVRSRENFDKEEWLIIISTDHGGIDHGHGGSSPEETTIFFIINNLKNPVPNKPAHSKLYIIDVPPTIASFFGIQVKPEWKWEGNTIIDF